MKHYISMNDINEKNIFVILFINIIINKLNSIKKEKEKKKKKIEKKHRLMSDKETFYTSY